MRPKPCPSEAPSLLPPSPAAETLQCLPEYALANLTGHYTQEVLLGRSGAPIPMTAINLHSPVYLRLQRFQFVQSAPGAAVLRFVPAPGFSPQHEQELRRELSARLAGEVDLTLEPVSEIPLTPAGKHRFIVRAGEIEQG